jgi:hypothetical protein
MRRLRQAATVGVYRINDPSAFSPTFHVSFREALRMVEEGSAVTINKSTAIRLVMVDRHAQYEFACQACGATHVMSPILALEHDGPVECRCGAAMIRRDESANASERPWNFRDQSTKMRDRIAENFADGKAHARSLVGGRDKNGEIFGWAENYLGIAGRPSGAA